MCMPMPESHRVRVLLVREDDSGSSILATASRQDCAEVHDQVSLDHTNAGVHQGQDVLGL